MKKIIALLLTLAMLFTFTAALAEAAEETIPNVGHYQIVNNTSKELKTVTFVENADTNNNGTVSISLQPGDFTFTGFYIAPDAEAHHALTISFQFDDGTECSFATLSIEEATLTLTDEDVVSGATPFKFGALVTEE